MIVDRILSSSKLEANIRTQITDFLKGTMPETFPSLAKHIIPDLPVSSEPEEVRKQRRVQLLEQRRQEEERIRMQRRARAAAIQRRRERHMTTKWQLQQQRKNQERLKELESEQQRLQQQRDEATYSLEEIQKQQEALKKEAANHSSDYTFCEFCGQEDPSWNEDGLKTHIAKECPMFYPCTFCKKVVPLPRYEEHLKYYCELKEKIKRCEECQIYYIGERSRHIARCRPHTLNPGETVCQLCKRRFMNTEEGWISHLLISANCLANKRQRKPKDPE